MPTRGRLPLLRQSLACVLAQEHVPLEIVISDNWSEDGTREHCLDLAARDARVRYVRPPVPLGLYANHNFALKQATGRYVCFFHDDDLYTRSIVGRYAAFLDAHPTAGAVCSAWERIDEGGRPIGRRVYELSELTRGLEYIDRTLRAGGSALALSGSMFRRDALSERPFDENGPLGFTDIVAWFRLAETWDIGYIPKKLWSYRAHSAAFSNASPGTIADDHTIAFGAYCEEFLERHPGEAVRVARWRRAIRRYRFWVLMYDVAVRPSSGPRDALFTQLAQTAAGPLERAAVGALRISMTLGVRRPLAIFARYALSRRWLIGFR
jgi:glycosyltransferase involved in cell wall biosynthesis